MTGGIIRVLNVPLEGKSTVPQIVPPTDHYCAPLSDTIVFGFFGVIAGSAIGSIR